MIIRQKSECTSMNYEKWRLVGGKVYRLAEVFDSGRDAVLFARTMKHNKFIVISKTLDARWAVYWRARNRITSCDTVICTPS